MQYRYKGLGIKIKTISPLQSWFLKKERPVKTICEMLATQITGTVSIYTHYLQTNA